MLKYSNFEYMITYFVTGNNILLRMNYQDLMWKIVKIYFLGIVINATPKKMKIFLCVKYLKVTLTVNESFRS